VNGAIPQTFDFCFAMRRLCEDVCHRVPVFQHIEMDQIAVAFAQTRRGVTHGLQAKLTPMRFEAGALTTSRGDQSWTVQRLFQGEEEMLYILTFYLPRFLNQTYREKMVTVFHELYHVSEHFDGDIRRWEGRCYVHSQSEKEYDRLMEKYVDEYLAGKPPVALRQFLRYKFRGLEKRFGAVVGIQIPIPKLIPLPDDP